jgi:UDP-glucose 4-epimerase
MSRYLVTGGAGFIGSHLCDRLLAAGHALRIIDDMSTGSRDNLPAETELCVGDAADRAFVEASAVGVDGIFHIAAIASVERSTRELLQTHRANQTATVTILDVARAAGRLPVVLASSAAVYGDNGPQPLTETATPRPVTAYGVDKLGSELHARVAWEIHGVPTAALRIFNAFGPRQALCSDYSGVISVFANRIIGNQPPIIHGDGQQTRDFIYVGDVVRHFQATMSSLEANPRAFVCNVCTGKAVTIEALARRMVALAGLSDLQIEFDAARMGDIRHCCGAPSLALRELGIFATTPLDQGLTALLDTRNSA